MIGNKEFRAMLQEAARHLSQARVELGNGVDALEKASWADVDSDVDLGAVEDVNCAFEEASAGSVEDGIYNAMEFLNTAIDAMTESGHE